MNTVNFKGMKLTVQEKLYPNGRLALQLIDEAGKDYMVATVNLPDEPIVREDFIFIKDYSENAGILAALISAGIVNYIGVSVPTGYAKADLVRYIAREPKANAQV